MTPIAFIYKSIKRLWFISLYNPFCYVATLIILHSNKVQHGSFRTNGIPIINVNRKGKGKITIGDNLRMNNGNVANTIGYSSCCTFLAIDGAHLHIHDDVGMSQTALCAVGADITIGRHTLLGGGVKVYSSDFHSTDYMNRRNRKTDRMNRKSASVIIGDDCFIGAGTIILKGVTIGARTIIGAGSVVTKSIPSDCMAAGNPCEVIKCLEK